MRSAMPLTLCRVRFVSAWSVEAVEAADAVLRGRVRTLAVLVVAAAVTQSVLLPTSLVWLVLLMSREEQAALAELQVITTVQLAERRSLGHPEIPTELEQAVAPQEQDQTGSTQL
jgi:hypothetical protein